MESFKESFEVDACKGTIIFHNREDITIKGQIEESVKGGLIQYKAANPMDKRSSFSGSGLPFANYYQAFENSPNKGEVELSLGNVFEIQLLMPNSYYVSLGTVLVCPTLFIEYNNGEMKKIIPIKLNNPVPFRSLTYPISQYHASRQNATFYEGMKDLPVRSQEQILRDSAYPETFNKNDKHENVPMNFWGLKPPV